MSIIFRRRITGGFSLRYSVLNLSTEERRDFFDETERVGNSFSKAENRGFSGSETGKKGADFSFEHGIFRRAQKMSTIFREGGTMLTELTQGIFPVGKQWKNWYNLWKKLKKSTNFLFYFVKCGIFYAKCT
ncbi:MAG: hypothetical protein E7479_00600 [Ruminococcaceae bacterium]|nr:hypothetical protein [Oscillospiraceae bacterium]